MQMPECSTQNKTAGNYHTQVLSAAFPQQLYTFPFIKKKKSLAKVYIDTAC